MQNGENMGRKKGDTRERILGEALKLFSIDGFKAVSVRAIADAVGIENSALYKHFKSKREIFDAIVEIQKEKYLAQCSQITADIRGIDSVKKSCLSMFEYQTQEESIVAFRRMLLIEKFKDPEMAGIYKSFFVDVPLENQRRIFEELQEKGLMIEGDTRVFAMELYAPFYLYHFVEHEKEVLIPKLEKHLEYFFNSHFIKEVQRQEMP